MIKDTVYNDLLSYKIPEDDKKILADTFIFLQKNNINVALSILIKLYLKKINITKFLEQCQFAVNAGVELPFAQLTDSVLNKDDLLNLTEGFVVARTENISIEFPELEQLGKMKISLSSLIRAIAKLKTSEPDLEFNDFKKNSAFLYKPDLYVKELFKLKKIDSSVVLKKIIQSRFSLTDIEEIVTIGYKLQNLKTKISISELIKLKSGGLKIKEIVNGIEASEKLGSPLSLSDITTLESRGISADKLIKSSLEPETVEFKSVSTTVKSGYEIIVKATLKTLTIPEFIIKANGSEKVAETCERIIGTIISEYNDLVELKTKKAEIENKIYDLLKIEIKTRKVLSFNINDMIAGRNLKAEQLKLEQEIYEREAAVAEAKLRFEKAKSELDEFLQKHRHIPDEILIEQHTTHETHNQQSQKH